MRDALWTSLKAGLGATAIALVLGTMAALAVSRYRFFGRDTMSFLVILPLALPGIVTGMALNATFTQVLNVDLTLFTVIVGHATFCIVVVYNNAVARLRRTGTSLEEASQDLGADGWQTFRNITMPSLRSALVAGALLAFALSFDEIIVTTFTAGANETLPIWIFNNYSRPNQLPIVNVVALGGDPAVAHPGVPGQPPEPGSLGHRRRARRSGRRPLGPLAASDRGEAGHHGAHERLRSGGQPEHVVVLAEQRGEPGRARDARASRGMAPPEAVDRREPLERAKGGRRPPESAGGRAAGVPHLVSLAPGHVQGVAGAQRALVPVHPGGELALEHLEALILSGVKMRAAASRRPRPNCPRPRGDRGCARGRSRSRGG